MEVKLSQHWNRIAPILEQTAGKSIVELSHKDQFWGTVHMGNGQLICMNALGNLFF
jgi:predicted NAD-dependent protein-ADP-ribosyltransferase YbiA (DUF1768 family)